MFRVVTSSVVLFALFLSGCSSVSDATQQREEVTTQSFVAEIAVISDIPQLESAIPDGTKKQSAQPASLTIDSLEVTSAVVRPAGVEDNGDMEVPEATEVGWYKYGSRPGGEGSVVLAAHIAESGVDGVFRHLEDIQQGAEVVVSLEDGSQMRYEVSAVEEYKKTALPFDDVFKRSGEEQLVLITCGGDFNASLRSYESNVVAYASPIS